MELITSSTDDLTKHCSREFASKNSKGFSRDTDRDGLCNDLRSLSYLPETVDTLPTL
jgi:hypothetical protein